MCSTLVALLSGFNFTVCAQASSALARGEMQLLLREGGQLPPGAALGPDGSPTLDPATGLAGAQLPLGGPAAAHKGANLALMVRLHLWFRGPASFARLGAVLAPVGFSCRPFWEVMQT